MIGYKNFDLKAEDIDEVHRKVVIYVSEFGSKDSDGDIIRSGAFTKTIQERGPKAIKPRIRHLRDHWDLVGKPLEMQEDDKGLLVVSQISNSSAGKDLIEDYKLDMFEHSIGFEVVKSEDDPSTETNYLIELKLWEYSSVTWGANENTPMVAMKGYSYEDILNRLNSKMDRLSNALKKGNYTDERFENIEYQIQVLKKGYNDYINSLTKPQESTSNEPDLKALETIFNNFKLNVNGRKGN